MNMKQAFIFAAGLGTRLKPLTDTMPKALVPVMGKPLLQHQLEKMKNIGVTDVIINVHHFADMIEKWCEEHPMDINILFSDEREQLLETGGAVHHAKDLIKDGRFLIHNCDILSNANLDWFYQQGEGRIATLLVSKRETSRYLLFDDEMRLVGWTNVKTGEIKSPYKNLNIEGLHRLAFSGIHQMDKSAINYMKSWPEKFPIIDFYLELTAKAPVYGVCMDDLRLMDVGKIDTLSEAETFLKNED